MNLAALLVQAPIYVGGMFTDSASTVPTPQAPRGTAHAIVSVDFRSRYAVGWETDFVTFQGVGGCAWQSVGSVRTHASVRTNGAQLVGGRTMLRVDAAGLCVPFDGVYDWSGASGGGTGLVWRPIRLSKLVPIYELGPTITVDADGSSTWSQVVACGGIPPYEVAGSIAWFSQSWWEGELRVKFVP